MNQPEQGRALRPRSVGHGNRPRNPVACHCRLLLGEIAPVDAAGVRGLMWAELLLLCFAPSPALDPRHRVAGPHTVISSC